MFIFERERVSRGGADRDGVTESEAGSRGSNMGLELMSHEIITWAQVRR